jgi:hypothetical protein
MSFSDYQPPPGLYGPPPPSSGKATAALVLGIAAFVVCPLVCAVLAIVFANQAYSEIDASGGRVGGRGLAQAGLILGWVNIALCVLALLFFIAVIAIGSSSGY